MSRFARILSVLLITACPQAFGSRVVSNGSDGAFHPTASQTIDLPADGIFNFTTIDIPGDVTIRFRGNTDNTPVRLRATGSVSIAGVLDVSAGGVSVSDLAHPTLGYIRPATTARGGPGGGSGGISGIGDTTCAPSATQVCRSAGPGTGPSAGQPGPTPTHTGLKVYGVAGGGGGMATPGSAAVRYTTGVEGSPAIAFPTSLTGGSGGGGGSGWYFFGVQLGGGAGGGGGGALEISTPADIAVSGSLLALGANGGWSFANSGGQGGPGGGGSGGTVALIGASVTLLPSARVDATGGYGGGLSTQTYPNDPRAFENGARGGEGFLYVEGTSLALGGTIDAVVVAVPEPSAYAMMAAGLGWLLLVGWRRRPGCAGCDRSV